MAEHRIVFDTNVLWHGMLPSEDPIAPTCKRLIQGVDDGEIEAYSSTLSLVELPKVIEPPLPIEALIALTEALRDSAIVWVPLTKAIAMRARDLSLERELVPAYDAVILATAVEVRASSLYTYDQDDFPVGETVDGVDVSIPKLPPHLAQGSFEFDQDDQDVGGEP